MAQVTSDFLQALFTDYRLLFEDWFLAAQNVNDYTRFCTVVESKTLTESFNWLGTVPKMRLWVDERVHQSIAPSYNYAISNNHYEATIDVDRDTIEDDTYGLIRPRVMQLGEEAGRYPWELFVSAVTANGTCYDGQAFFSTTHKEDQNTANQSNLLSGTGTDLVHLRADFVTARAAIRRFLDGKNRPMNLGLTGLTVLAPPELEDVFDQLLNNEFIVEQVASGVFAQASNNFKGAASLVVDPYLTDTNDWYLLDLSRPVKPFIYLNRKAPEFVAQDDPRDYSVFNKRMFSYGADFRGNVGYGMWQFAVNVHQ